MQDERPVQSRFAAAAKNHAAWKFRVLDRYGNRWNNVVGDFIYVVEDGDERLAAVLLQGSRKVCRVQKFKSTDSFARCSTQRGFTKSRGRNNFDKPGVCL
jgi:hypothetical protein